MVAEARMEEWNVECLVQGEHGAHESLEHARHFVSRLESALVGRQWEAEFGSQGLVQPWEGQDAAVLVGGRHAPSPSGLVGDKGHWAQRLRKQRCSVVGSSQLCAVQLAARSSREGAGRPGSSYVTCRPMFHHTPIVHASGRPGRCRSARPSIPHSCSPPRPRRLIVIAVRALSSHAALFPTLSRRSPRRPAALVSLLLPLLPRRTLPAASARATPQIVPYLPRPRLLARPSQGDEELEWAASTCT